uniref:Uncharacterized protein n=1 Tax=Dulem virus 35 TaxID=3145753 RepID=A0AAU8B0E4_9CAUD
MSLPKNINETVTPNEDGSYTIFIEESLSPQFRKKAFFHAMKHITGGDFEKESVNKIELIAHFA